MNTSRAEFFAGRDVLVTGAGGFIGSALVRELARFAIRSLVLLDSSEQNLFELQRDLTDCACHFALGSVAEREFVRELLACHRPSVIFHAAAYKHVSLLEGQFVAAIANNTLGSYSLAIEAARFGVERVVVVSTDKAVRPRSVMGVSKRAAELLTIPLGCSAIRLGNVLGSTGSVVPLLREQVRRRRPLTVTDADAARFIFSIEETVNAIVAAAASDLSGCVLLPRFGEPVRIVDLARSLSADLPIEFIGLRPGEKLTEEFLYPEETVIGEAGGLFMISGRMLEQQYCEDIAAQLAMAVDKRDRARLLRVVSDLEPSYSPSEVVRKELCAR